MPDYLRSEHSDAGYTRYNCRHIFTDGRRCAAFSLRNETFCYFHHTTRGAASPNTCRTRRRRSASFAVPPAEDRSAVQYTIGEVLRRIASNEIDPRRAGLLLYGLQIASMNLPRLDPKAAATRTADPIDHITQHPTLGPLAPELEWDEDEMHSSRKLSGRGQVQALVDRLDREAAGDSDFPYPPPFER